MNILLQTFMKNLGKGRAWIHPTTAMQEFYEVLISPLAEVKEYITNLKYAHFPTKNPTEENILNGETLFGITHIANTPAERASNVELEWAMLAGNLNFKTLENALKKAGFKIRIYENTNVDGLDLGTGFYYGTTNFKEDRDGTVAQYGAHLSRVIGNGFLDIAGTTNDPVELQNGHNAFFIQGYFDPNDSEWEYITELVLKLKPGHAVAVCQIAERKNADNAFYNTTEFADAIDGGTPYTTDWFEWLNKDERELALLGTV